MATTTDPRHAERLKEGASWNCAHAPEFAEACRAGAAALRAQAETERAAKAVIDKAVDDVRALRAELEAAADRESARVLMAHENRDLGQRVLALSAALREVLELAAWKLDRGHWDSDEQVQDVFTRAQSALPAPPSEAK